jgi:hypothetical protein
MVDRASARRRRHALILGTDGDADTPDVTDRGKRETGNTGLRATEPGRMRIVAIRPKAHGGKN